ncbi:MAG: GlsB/YeaQ/YmgE family stress response membrane protein [Acidimicrobiales bacterium]
MGILAYLLLLVFQGLIVGALGRLAIPGPNPMSIGTTILVGIGGSFLGGLVGLLIGGRGFGFILGVLGAALIVYLLQRNRGGRPIR